MPRPSIRLAGAAVFAAALLTPSAAVAVTPRDDTERGSYMEFHWYRGTRTGFAAATVFLSKTAPSVVEANLISNDPGKPSYWSRIELPKPEHLAGVDVRFPADPSGTTRVKLAVQADGPTKPYRWRSTWFDRWVWETPLAITGTLVFPNGRTFDLGDGNGIATRVNWFHVQREWVPRGREGDPLPNDRPKQALTLQPGSAHEVGNVAARLGPELEPDPFEHALARTVWYRFTGTGKPMTFDTKGSDFDTAFMVYRDGARGDDGLQELGYHDQVVLGRTTDAMTLQARATFETVAGASYYVQVGSVGAVETGNAWSGYGRLRVSLH